MTDSRYYAKERTPIRAAVVVAHPDDETLWAGGVLLTRPRWRWTVVTLCRGSDPDRAPKFARVLGRLGAAGGMADLDDGPDQEPLAPEQVASAALAVLPERRYDLILTHSPFGEYTRHRRHEETSAAVATLWENGRLAAGEVWMFAYHDADGKRLPEAIPGAHLSIDLDENLWREKRDIIVSLYGFVGDSWEARVTPRREAFWCFHNPADYRSWYDREVRQR